MHWYNHMDAILNYHAGRDMRAIFPVGAAHVLWFLKLVQLGLEDRKDTAGWGEAKKGNMEWTIISRERPVHVGFVQNRVSLRYLLLSV